MIFIQHIATYGEPPKNFISLAYHCLLLLIVIVPLMFQMYHNWTELNHLLNLIVLIRTGLDMNLIYCLVKCFDITVAVQ